jgi:hypothetical protein
MAGRKGNGANMEDQNTSSATGETSAATAPASKPPPASVATGTPGATNLGPELTSAKAQIETLGRANKKLQKELEDANDALNVQREEVARLQGLLNQLSKSQLPELGEGAYEVGEGATILGSVTLDGAHGRVHALAGDVLVLDSLKAPAFAKVKETVAAAVPGGKARVYVVSKATLTELQELQLLRT